MFWTAGLNTAMGATLAGGSTWVTQERFEPGHALRLLERERVTEPHVFAHEARALEEHPDWTATDLSSCTKVFGKSVFTRHPSVRGDASWNMPVGYGMSETSSFLTGLPWTTPRAVFRKGSYGQLLPGNELRVVDPETGRVRGPDEEGELIVRGPTLMEHYVKRTRAECFDADGFFHTGDLGSYDDDGYVYWSGRRTEMIKTAGANVSPAEIEVQLHAYEPVKLARVIGVPDERRDEIAVLCVELKDGATATEDDIQAFLRERLASYKVPKRVLFFGDDEIPMNRSGTKVQHEQLLAVVQERLTP
jgi:acyl-CoA synthetase (AMP-forming)/AMP-acid ligase II